MVKRKAISKTKALAMRRKTGSAAVAFKVKSINDSGCKSRDVLLSHLMEQYLLNNSSDDEQRGVESLSFGEIMSRLNMNDHNTGWRNAWKDLQKSGFTEQLESGGFFTTPFRLTQQGRDEASTEEMKEVLAKKPKTNFQTNQELHEHIKGKLMNKRGEEIFDLLLQDHEKNGDGMNRKELAKALGISDTGAYFSYALQQLKDLGYAEGKKTRLTEKAFVKGKDVKKDAEKGYEKKSGGRNSAIKEEEKEKVKKVKQEKECGGRHTQSNETAKIEKVKQEESLVKQEE